MTFTVITASAGSGKTYRLTQELSERLSQIDSAEGAAHLKPSEIIATTFSVRAAADLVEKTQQRLLDDGNVTAAEEIQTALIGTVNAVAGRIVSEYAIDAGYSPQLRVLDEAEQEKAFHIAVDDIIAAAEADHRALLVRTGYDLPADDDSRFAQSSSWAKVVNDVVTAARANLLGADELQESAEASVAEFLSILPTPVEDGRGRWKAQVEEDVSTLHLMLGVMEGDLDRAINGGAAAFVRFPITDQSRSNVEGSVLSVRHFLRGLSGNGSANAGADPFARVPWSKWATVASANYAAAGGGKKPGKVPLQVFTSSSAALVSDELLANRAFQDDVSSLIRLVFTTAIDALSAYEEYKDRLGVMDFVDQEVRALRLLRSNPRVRESLSSRYRLLAVDEFQDTAPIQLALFMELASLVDDVIWVGDRKQAIYGFRGADPQLMNDVFSALVEGEWGDVVTESLTHSWRSSEAPLELSNTIFRSVFADQPESDVVLSIPPQREDRRHEGGREVWVADNDKWKDSRASGRLAKTIADGVVDFLRRGQQVPVSSSGDGAAGPTHRAVQPGDIAVLLRTNNDVGNVVGELRDRGVPAAGSTVSLLGTREGQYVLAGLATVVDPADTLALTELVTLLPDHERHESWFEDAVRIVDPVQRSEFMRSWWDDETLAALAQVRDRVSELAPSTLLLEVIDALDLPQRIKGWSTPDTRLGHLDGLRQLAAEYEAAAQSTRSPVSAAGLLAHLKDTANAYAATSVIDAVTVTTMHQSKGLQWPVVVSGIPQVKDHGHRVVSVQMAERFDVRQPLADRSIRFLPKLVGGYGDLKDRLAGSAVVRDGAVADREESARLHYVSLTRAELFNILAFATPDGAGNALGESVGGDPLVEWDDPAAGTADGVVRVRDQRAGGHVGTDLRVLMRRCTIEGEPERLTSVPQDSPFAFTDVPLRRPAVSATTVPSRFTASSAPSEGREADIEVVATLGEPLVTKGGMDWDVVGDAVHSYLGIPHQVMPVENARAAAERIIDRWAVRDALTVDALVEAGARWVRWVEATYPGSTLLTEQPIAWRNELHQSMEGWIDARIILADGSHVLVDHKSYPGTDPVGHVRENYVGQMSAYSAALEATTGEKPREILIHLPLRGEVVRVVLQSSL